MVMQLDKALRKKAAEGSTEHPGPSIEAFVGQLFLQEAEEGSTEHPGPSIEPCAGQLVLEEAEEGSTEHPGPSIEPCAGQLVLAPQLQQRRCNIVRGTM